MFIMNNSSEVFLESIHLNNLNQIACNLDTEHMESIVTEEGIQGCNYGSFEIEICLKRKSEYSTQVRVNDMTDLFVMIQPQFLYGQSDMMIPLIKLQLQKIIIGSMLLCC